LSEDLVSYDSAPAALPELSLSCVDSDLEGIVRRKQSKPERTTLGIPRQLANVVAHERAIGRRERD
jgi:hypothetical protein